MSIELPEATILAEQMSKELIGKWVKSYELKDWERLQRIGFINRDLKAFDQLINKKVLSVSSRGNVILVRFSGDANLILCPEYGGEIFYHAEENTKTDSYHLNINFVDGSSLTVRLMSMGGIYTLKDEELAQSYVFKRDFNSAILSPLDAEFTRARFSRLLGENSRALKSVLVGKDAIVVGLSNSAFQDIIYRAGLHPKRKSSELNTSEKFKLYDGILLVVRERLRLNGKDQFRDIYMKRGGYTPAMGPNMKQQKCQKCGQNIQKLSLGGGQVYFCPKCQIQ